MCCPHCHDEDEDMPCRETTQFQDNIVLPVDVGMSQKPPPQQHLSRYAAVAAAPLPAGDAPIGMSGEDLLVPCGGEVIVAEVIVEEVVVEDVEVSRSSMLMNEM